MRSISPKAAVVLGLALAAASLGAGKVDSAGTRSGTSTKRNSAGLIAAARQGDRARVADLLRAGADPDVRDRESGTALDAAEKAGHDDVADILRANGARGSGKSVGDVVCVTPWAGSGFCGRVESRRGNFHGLDVLWLEGCGEGCAPDPQCSAGRPVGGAAPDAVRPGSAVVVPSWCLTRTGVVPRR
jgi:hypothetical protein